MNNRTLIATLAALAVVAAVSFWGGTYYQSRQFFTGLPNGMMGAGRFPGAPGQMRSWGGSAPGQPGLGNRASGGRPRGEPVISGRLDQAGADKLTLTTRMGSVKVEVDKDTVVKKAQKTAATDLKPGAQVFIKGVFKADGQLSAKSVIVE